MQEEQKICEACLPDAEKAWSRSRLHRAHEAGAKGSQGEVNRAGRAITRARRPV